MSFYEKKGEEFHQYPENGIKYSLNLLEQRLLDEIEQNFNKGLEGSDLIAPLVKSYLKLLLHPVNSIYFDFANKILIRVKDLEVAQSTEINKYPLLFFMALTAVKLNNPVGAILFWELSKKEESRVTSSTLSLSASYSSLPQEFKSIFNEVDRIYKENAFVAFCLSSYNGLVKDFKTLLFSFTDINKASLLSCGIKNVEVSKWMIHYHNTLDINRLFAQELINSLSVLVESHIKTKLTDSKNTLGAILNHNLPINLSAIIGTASISKTINLILGLQFKYKNKRASGLFRTYKTGTENKFNANYQRILSVMQTESLDLASFKAYVLYAAYMIRNASLHEYNENLVYYTDAIMFQKTIGVLFVALNVIDTL